MPGTKFPTHKNQVIFFDFVTTWLALVVKGGTFACSNILSNIYFYVNQKTIKVANFAYFADKYKYKFNHAQKILTFSKLAKLIFALSFAFDLLDYTCVEQFFEER